jgi:MFS superfamily sulfate permease-like transporter
MKTLMLPIVKGDLMGGLSAAIITLPMSIAYGIAAFAPLGPEFRFSLIHLQLTGFRKF